LAACGTMAAALPLSRAFAAALPRGCPFLPFLFAVLVSGTLFDQGAAFLATALSAALAAWCFLPPAGSFRVEDPHHAFALLLFLAVGASIAAVVEVLHSALLRERRARADLARSEEQRRLLLNEFRHRTRNDLQSLAALLLLRARSAPSSAAADGLREAAEHARALARAHAWLAHGDVGDDEHPARVDTKEFVEGFCRDLGRALLSGELRPIALIAAAESHTLDSERAVHLGLALNELVTNALKYAFPDSGAGTVHVRFAREGNDFVLSVSDDGIGMSADDARPHGSPAGRLPRGTGLGTRLLQGLAAQLRGTLSREGGGGAGTSAELRFPAGEPCR
ncbi:MAG: DUF4118 domain-containing protein, partial [Acetobacteraceae bacterium]|nr:DUF4118 domain-containing protein [Acetobacteraceae bacterium]